MNLPVDEELDRGVGNTNAVEDILEVIRDETVTRPLREEGDSDNNDHTSPVSRGSNESLPANVSSNLGIEFEGSLDFLILVLDDTIIFVTIGVIVGQSAQSLSIATFADEPTGGLWDKDDEADLKDGGDTLQEGRKTPGPR